jgi:hypothetical protein
MKLVTIVNKDHPGLKLWKDTAAAHGYDATVLMDTNAEIGHDHGKFGAKLIMIGNYVKERNDLILVTDGFDVAFVEDASSLEERIRATLGRDEMLFSGEVYENPDKGMPWSAGRLPFLNAGVFVGYADTIWKNLQPFLTLSKTQQAEFDDQRYWQQRHFANPKIRVDVDGDLFASLLDVKGDVKAGVYHFQGFYKNLSVLEFTPHWQAAKAIHRNKSILAHVLEQVLDVTITLVPWLKPKPRYMTILLIVALVLLFISTCLKM